MKDRIAEMILMAVILFLLVTSVFFWYDRTTNKYIRETERWRGDVTNIINHNIQTGQLGKPVVPSVPPGK